MRVTLLFGLTCFAARKKLLIQKIDFLSLN